MKTVGGNYFCITASSCVEGQSLKQMKITNEGQSPKIHGPKFQAAN